MIKPLKGDRWGKQETTKQGRERQLMWEKGEKVTEKEDAETKDDGKKWWKMNSMWERPTS